MPNTTLTNLFALAGRVLISVMFITSGWGKIAGYAGTAAYMAKAGVPGALLPLVILTELGGGLAILVGFQTRIAAFLLAGFCLVSGVLFHYLGAQAIDTQMAGVTDPAQLAALGQAKTGQMINFWKNVSIAGGFLAFSAFGAGAWSLDGRRAA